jgi:hypothetical protein
MSVSVVDGAAAKSDASVTFSGKIKYKKSKLINMYLTLLEPPTFVLQLVTRAKRLGAVK